MSYYRNLRRFERQNLQEKGLALLFVFGRLDLVSCDMGKLQAVHNAVVYEMLEGDPHNPYAMAAFFITDYLTNITEEMRNGKDYDTVVEEYSGATTYVHELMKNGDFRSEEERELEEKQAQEEQQAQQVRVKQEEDQL